MIFIIDFFQNLEGPPTPCTFFLQNSFLFTIDTPFFIFL
eukprot:UN04600